MATKKKTDLSDGKEFDGNLGDKMIMEGGKMKLKEKGRSPNRIPYGEVNYQPVPWSDFKKKYPDAIKMMKENAKKKASEF